ncbi:hypothetical protein K437DRAFT_265623 [Tilletiaria anomala UBC 951]|uniref:SWI5-dependent HO expression protein 3 n=1 Tax=Tilletiaria anomala (strain ATCC 24038 / CBS 436.72 / UBC 951) TaxID=1037660 RepID=A0A066WS94_TILAU|nr:uncharacterized protein K437DRAFT_265623 [Tilletiaria anomala UBC 951]KDN53560.1 hypothetical protein K437DRAFT_265623 [Tilletiaria anomala UBC 951]
MSTEAFPTMSPKFEHDASLKGENTGLVAEGTAGASQVVAEATDPMDRIAQLEAVLKEKEAIIEALSLASPPRLSGALDASDPLAEVQPESAYGSRAKRESLPSPTAKTGRSSLKANGLHGNGTGGASEPSAPHANGRRRSSSLDPLSSPNLRQQSPKNIEQFSSISLAGASRDVAAEGTRERRSSNSSMRSTRTGVSIKVDSSSRRSSLSSATLKNGNIDGSLAPSDYASDNGSVLGLHPNGDGSRKSPAAGNWATKFRRAPSPAPSNVSEADSVSSSRGGGGGSAFTNGLGAWRRASLQAVGRRRKSGIINLDHSLVSPTTPGSATSESGPGGLGPLREAGARSTQLAVEGFSAPTIASENRRLAVLAQQAQAITSGTTAANVPNGSNPGAGGSGKVISALTAELQSTKNLLDNARSALRASQRSTSAAQRGLEDTKEALGRSRQENENMSRMLERKDRQLAEALERARKAESESKDLGRQSREWGTRVREVESELGEVRREKAKDEAQYEAIRSAWDSTREMWRKELQELREQVAKRDEERQQHVDQMKSKLDQMDALYQLRVNDTSDIEGAVSQLKLETDKAAALVRQQVEPLAKQADFIEQEERRMGETVDMVHRELKRILRLARAGDTSGG